MRWPDGAVTVLHAPSEDRCHALCASTWLRPSSELKLFSFFIPAISVVTERCLV